jgi:filamentous hemagglutinin family protein
MRLPASAAALLLTLAVAPSGLAKVVGDGSLAPEGLVPGGVIGTTPVDYLITPEHGALRDTNLFYSFSDFSIEAGRIGVFTGPPEVQNILARVTGRAASTINGTLASTITGADLWLVNPNGVMFGAGSQLALRGAFHASTGSYIRLADGSIFSAANPDAGGLTVAAPEAFGFLGGETGAIDVDVTGNLLRGRAFERFALVGGDVSIHAGAQGEFGFLWAQDARIDLVGVQSSGSAPVEVALYSGGAEALDVTGPWRGRAVTIDRNAVVSSSGVNPAGGLSAFQQGGGDIHVFGRSFTVANAEIRSQTGGAERGGNIDIDLTEDLLLRGGDNASGLFAGTGVVQGAFQFFGLGDGGDIAIRARNVSLLDGAQIGSTSLFLGDAGDVSIDASGLVRIVGRNRQGEPAGIFSNTAVAGAGGRISISAPTLELDRGGLLVTETRGVGAGGSIDVDVERLTMRGGARIDTSTRSNSDPPAAGGTIHINASKSVRIAGRESDEVFTGITAIAQDATDTLPESTARAGDITVDTPRLAITDGAEISTAANGSGDGGSILLRTGHLRVDGGIISAAAKTGVGGDVTIEARRTAVFIGGSEVSARASGAGDAGKIDIDAGQELVLDSSAITTESALSNGGEISLRARKLLSMKNGDVTTSVTGGTGGNIDIDPQNVVLNESQIIARAGAGTGGNIRIVAGQFVNDAHSTVDASAETGIDGTVEIQTPEVDQNSALDALPSDYADPSNLLRAACAARGAEAGGTFVIRSHARAAASPDAPLGAPDEVRPEGCEAEPAPTPASAPSP